MNARPHRLKVKDWACAMILGLASTTASAARQVGVGLANPDPNLPVYDREAPLGWAATPQPGMDPDPRAISYEFFGGDYTEDPPPPYSYLMGREPSRDLASPTRTVAGDGRPDTWFRLNAPNLGFYLRRGGGYYIKDLILQTKGYPYRRWDTLANSRYPLLQVFYGGHQINSATGSIAGFNPPQHGVIDLYIADDGLIATRHTPLELIIRTLDGELRVGVGLYNLHDSKID
ncbi:hypothetical protein [uncultured Thiodictyon sp.]|uniref:hypothetical protein n=1 Tax=uncultured Thiodictyon sp. TaxID=1846217 RepID=UPI0025E5ACF0|nr:hypothetical protein [uncultured Thiodictyon sp.]